MQGKGTSTPYEGRMAMIAGCALYAYLQACYWNSGSVNWAKTGGNVVSVDYSSNGGTSFTTYYYLRNAQNDVVKLIDGNGNTVVQYTYDSWGKHIATTGTLASTVGQNQPFRYRGYVYDAETGWYYLQSRYYDPTICRFISADIYFSTGHWVLGHNAYTYCLNNPAIYSDVSGYNPKPFNVLMTDSGKQPDNQFLSYAIYSFIDESCQIVYEELVKMGLLCLDNCIGTITSVTIVRDGYYCLDYSTEILYIASSNLLISVGSTCVGFALGACIGSIPGSIIGAAVGYIASVAVAISDLISTPVTVGMNYVNYKVIVKGYYYITDALGKRKRVNYTYTYGVARINNGVIADGTDTEGYFWYLHSESYVVN